MGNGNGRPIRVGMFKYSNPRRTTCKQELKIPSFPNILKKCPSLSSILDRRYRFRAVISPSK